MLSISKSISVYINILLPDLLRFHALISDDNICLESDLKI